MDIAQLGFRIRSQDADTAQKRLDRMAGSAGRAEREAKDMGRAFGVAANDTRNLGRQFDYAGDQARRAQRDLEFISGTTGALVSRDAFEQVKRDLRSLGYRVSENEAELPNNVARNLQEWRERGMG